jgi:uncharacterized protein YceK
MKIKNILTFVAVGFCSSCASIIGHTSLPKQPYYGTRIEAHSIGEGNVGYAIDFPFTFIADTLLLPVDLWPKSPKQPTSDEERRLKVIQHCNEEHNAPIEFYGQVIDQDTNPSGSRISR